MHTGITLSFILGLLTAILGFSAGPWVLELTNTPANCLEDASAYVRIYFVGAVASMVHNLAFELAQHNIRVNQVIPGAIRTDRWDHITPEEETRRRANWPLGVESTGEDIANAVYFLASEQARTITGIDLAVDSGTLACLIGYHKT